MTASTKKPQVRALETEYNGHRFRSRLEARWAVFFDALGLDVRYECEGFDLDGTPYLPDFYLRERGLWVEVKPDLRSSDLSKPIALARLTGEPVVMLGDIPVYDSHGPHHLLVGYDRGSELTVNWFSWVPAHPDIGGVIEEPHGYPRYVGSENVLPDMWSVDISKVVDRLAVSEAFHHARQARFEHGAIPRQRRSGQLDSERGGRW